VARRKGLCEEKSIRRYVAEGRGVVKRRARGDVGARECGRGDAIWKDRLTRRHGDAGEGRDVLFAIGDSEPETRNLESGTPTESCRHSGPRVLSRRSLKGEDGNEELESSL
jgi:hypothetical protein